MSATNDVVLDKQAGLYLQAYPYVAVALPDSKPRPRQDFPEIVKKHFARLTEDGVISKAGRDPDSENGNNRHLWRVEPHIDGWVKRNVLPVNLTPCGRSSGVKTLVAGEKYTCSDPDCDCRFGREIAEEVLK